MLGACHSSIEIHGPEEPLFSNQLQSSSVSTLRVWFFYKYQKRLKHLEAEEETKTFPLLHVSYFPT